MGGVVQQHGSALLVCALLVAAPRATAQAPVSAPPPNPSIVALEAVEVIAPSPLARDARSLDSTVLEVRAAATPGVLRSLDRRVAGLALSEAQANPFQPSVTYRGFGASPLGGDAQGLAVYLDGVRFNAPFGDAVNWDLVPEIAVRSVTLVGSNPAFGLNALGGSISVALKDGFIGSGSGAELSGGSFGRFAGTLEYNQLIGDSALYVSAETLHEDGWRAHSPSTLRRLYTDLGWRAGADEVHLRLLGADNDLTGNGPAPVELLAADRAAVFTYPDRTQNRFGLASLQGRHSLGAAIAFTAQAYVSRLDQRTSNADLAEAEACDDAPERVCAEGDVVLTGPGGSSVPSTVVGPLGFARLNRTATRTAGYGGALQLSAEPRAFDMRHRFTAGISLDGGRTSFAADARLGGLALDRSFLGPGLEIDAADALVTPLRLKASNLYLGAYASDTVPLSSRLTLTLSARWNLARVQLRDQRGTALDGDHAFSRLNPAAGVAWRLARGVTAYARYAEGNRAPTPAELSCADPAAPCSLTSFFVSDPPLKQVVARTGELGARAEGRHWGAVRVSWRLSGFRTDTEDEIQRVASPALGRAYFRNIGSTRREGLEAELEGSAGPVSAFAAYSFTRATYRKDLTLLSPENPQADAAGLIHVEPGDRLPGAPEHLLKLGADWRVNDRLTLGTSARLAGGQVLFGDEANLTPRTAAYAVVDLEGRWRLTPRIELFASMRNLLDRDYETYGTFAPTGAVALSEAPGASEPRSLTPAPPRAFYAGMQVRL